MPRLLSRRSAALVAGLAAVSVCGYLIAAALHFRVGFPLDDAWIHQTYARNLAGRVEWSFIPGQPSAGSTAPLWSALLAIGHALGLGPYVWTYLLGWMALLGVALAGVQVFQRLQPQRAAWGVWVGCFLALEWRLVWASASGMETLLAALVILVTIAYLLPPVRNWFIVGALVGLSAWIRPDGITLVGPAAWVLLFEKRAIGERLTSASYFIAGLLCLFLPYLGFNRLLAGAWWPNTFFAKQAEYAALQAIPLLRRIAPEAGVILIGASALLLPGFIGQVVQSVRGKRWAEVAGPIWLAGYLILYAWRLPVTYQHGRYIMPAMPIFFVWGLAGMAGWLQLAGHAGLQRIVSRSWAAGLIMLTPAFWWIGAQAYARDVAFIESEMVATAQWVAASLPPDALLAAHDIGALGYFGQRDLLDLAGLVSPEVIPFMRDEPRLAEYLDRRRANYLVTFPGWYLQLVGRSQRVYSSGGEFAPAMGGENMGVYLWSQLPAP